jgi:ribose 1,5-bisphosphokinase PhnN
MMLLPIANAPPAVPLRQALLLGARQSRDAMQVGLRQAKPSMADQIDCEILANKTAALEAVKALHAKVQENVAAKHASRLMPMPCPDCGGLHSDDE